MAKQAPALYREKHRPGFHFSPPQNWINDPNGMVYYGGLYHLFYQYNPYDKVWGSMHWGHATSKDLLHWENRPVALSAEPDDLGFVFSGSTVVDWNNTSGLQAGDHPPLVAMFTHHSKYDEQVQSLAVSTNGGERWEMYAGNPVIANPGIADFRDPKVVWFDDGGYWVMMLAARDVIKFYKSPDLLNWEFLSDFGRAAGAHGGVWECPDLFALPVDDTDETRWVLLVSINAGTPNGGSATEYFVGHFDGRKFIPEHTEVLWMDYGPDNYASVSWSDVPDEDGRRIVLGWMSNWEYANRLPTAPWRGAMTVPRELRLIRNRDGIRLAAEPIRELDKLRTRTVVDRKDIRLRGRQGFAEDQVLPARVDVNLGFSWANGGSDDWAMRFFNELGEELTFDFRVSLNKLIVDRSRASEGIDDCAAFTKEIAAPLDLAGMTEIGIRLLIDTSSVEVFLGDGRSLLSLNFFVDEPLDRLELSARRAKTPVSVDQLQIFELAGTWE